MSMNEDAVAKVAARLTLDVSPALQQLQLLNEGMKSLGTDGAASIEKSGVMQLQALQSANDKMLSATESNQAAIKQLELNSSSARLMAWTEYYRQAENQQQLFEQKYLQNEQMFQAKLAVQNEKLAQLQSGQSSSSSSSGFHISAIEMAKDMVMWDTFSTIFQNVQEGLVNISKDAAGLQQVFHGDIQTQQQLNDVSNQFIDIAKQYGASVDEVMQAGKLWGRQYSEQIAEVLTQNSTLLSIVDNLSVTDANKAVESSMQALGMQVHNVNDAFTNSMRIIDSWTAVSHTTSVSTKDLADGFERAAASAKLVGLNVDQLSALVAAGVRNSGRTGTVVGNMWKSVLDNIASGSTKVQDAFNALGIQMYTVGANGQKQLKPIWDLLMQLSQAAEHATVSQTKYFSAIAGGKYQFDTLKAAVTDLSTLQNAYNESLQSAGTTAEKAQAQMHTLAAELTRLKDTIQQIAYNTGSGAIGDVLKGIVVGVTDLLNGLDKMPPVAGWVAAGFIAIVSAGKLLSMTMNGLTSLTNSIINGLNFWIVGAQKATLALTGQAAAAEATTVAVEAETVATEEATTAFFALDAASGGLSLAIGLVVTGLVALVGGLGASTKATNDAANAAAQYNEQLQQESEQAQQNADNTINQVNQLQNLKTAYEQATQALVNAKSGSDAAKQAESQLMDIRSQMIGIIGQEKTDQILASKDIEKAINDEVQNMLDANVTELQAINDRLKNQQMLTNGFVQQSNTRIAQLQTEMDAIQQAADMQQGYRGQFASDMQSIHPLNPTPSVAQQENIDALSQQQEDTWRRSLGYRNAINSTGPLDDKVAQAKAQADAHRVNPNITYSSGGGYVPPGPTNTTKKGTSGGTTSYTEPFRDLAQNDDMVLQPYNDNIKKLSDSMSVYDTNLNKTLSDLKSHINSTKDVTDATKAYDSEMQALKDHQSALTSENNKIHQLLPQIQSDINSVNAELQHGKISADEHRQAIQTLNSEYQRLTSTLESNTKAIADDAQKMTDVTNQMTAEMVDSLKTAYQDQQAMEEQALSNIYQPQIDALTQQKDAVDALISSLQEQWAIQDAQTKLTQDQSDLQKVMADRRYQIVNPDGSISWTYDTEKAQQIQDQITKDQRDVERTQLEQQKSTIEQELKNVQDEYNQKKQQLDDYWKYKLSQDNLNTEVDNAINKEGLVNAFNDIETYTSKMVNAWNAVQIAKTQALSGSGVASALGGTGFNPGSLSSVTSGSSKTAPNGQPYVIWSDRDRKYYYGTNFHDTEMAAGGYWQDGKWIKANTGGLIPKNLGTPGMDSVPALLTPGEYVLSAPVVDDIMRGFTRSGGSAGTVININGPLSFPNITKPSDGELFLESLTEKVGVTRVS